jgi:Arylsulfotransferase (ASST)
MARWHPTRPVALLTGLCAAGLLAGSADARGLRVIPFPGTPDAARTSRVIFSALRPSDLRSVTATGSRSGRHGGRLQELPAAAGTAFVPARPFTSGETVHVTATLSSPGAGTASGAPGATHLSYSFRVAVPVPASATGLEPPAWLSRIGHGPTQSFRSEPELRPPVVKVTRDPDTASGDIFVTPQNGTQAGPMILGSSGRLIWFRPVHAGLSDRHFTANLAVQRYQGQPVLTWWQGWVADGLIKAPSYDVIMDRAYRTVAVVRAGEGYVTDLHEFQITPQNTAFLDASVVTRANLTSVGGPPNGKVLDCVIEEVDVKTGEVLWEWHALGHVPIDASYYAYRPSEPQYDFFHLNSIQRLPDGNLLVSARDTWAVYEISRATGKVIWTLGGKDSDFKMRPGTRFEWQHDARLHGQTLSLFDDAANPQEEPQSSAKYLRVDTATRTVSLIGKFEHDPPLLASVGGSVQTLPNGNVFVGWGNQPQFSEFTPTGQQVFNGNLPLIQASYRVLRFAWVGRPADPPSLAVSPRPDGHVTTYASWNGATQVSAWRVLGGSTSHDLRPLDVRSTLRGFETTTDVPSEPRYFAVQALDARGKVLGTSRPHIDPPHLAVFGSRLFASTSGGQVGVPVGCLSGRSCRVTVTIRSRGSVRGQSAERVVPAERAAVVHLRLSASGQHELANASHHRLAVQVVVRSSPALPEARRAMTLIPYAGASPGPGSPIGFVSPAGRAAVLSPCYSPVPCHVQQTLSSSGRVIARTQGQILVGSNELADIGIPMNAAGRRMLARAPGNRLSAEIRTRTDGRLKTRQITLVAYR